MQLQKQHFTTFALVLFAAVVVGGVWTAGVTLYSPTTPGGNDEKVAMACKEDVFDAQNAALEKICTAEFARLLCPSDPAFAYEASNGCEISFLKNRGWTAAAE